MLDGVSRSPRSEFVDYFTRALPQDPAQFERIFYQFVEVAAAVRARKLSHEVPDAAAEGDADHETILGRKQRELDQLKAMSVGRWVVSGLWQAEHEALLIKFEALPRDKQVLKCSLSVR